VRVLVAMSGGVDSSLAAARLVEEGHEVVGATLKLWGGTGDSGCCSLADVTDARRVADELGIEHHVFNYEELFEREVVTPWVAAHARGVTPNPCVACNRSVKFGALLGRARRLGFDKLATGHHAQVHEGPQGAELYRGADRAKDQSYVLALLGAEELGSLLLPIGSLTKDEVRSEATRRVLRTAGKPDSQDLCFISAAEGGRANFLASRIELHRGQLRDEAGNDLGEVENLELLTLGQRRGLGVAATSRRYVVALDTRARSATLGDESALLVEELHLHERTWTGAPLEEGSEVLVQSSAHGRARPARLTGSGVAFLQPERTVAPGQVIACYQGDRVVGAGIVAADDRPVSGASR
jgi:tRNA-specific 2-thiouridylase